jgi:hypothetical protein
LEALRAGSMPWEGSFKTMKKQFNIHLKRQKILKKANEWELK